MKKLLDNYIVCNNDQNLMMNLNHVEIDKSPKKGNKISYNYI